MTATQDLHDKGQSLWLDNITRTMLDDGTIQRLHRRVLGDRPDLEPVDLRQGGLRRRVRRRDPREAGGGLSSGEDLFFELAIEDLRRAADLFRADPRAHRRRRWLRLARGLARAGPRHSVDRRRSVGRCTPVRTARTCSSRSRARPRVCPAIEETIAPGSR